jgi:hypothetical protein
MAIHRKADPGDLHELHSFFTTARQLHTIAPNILHNWEGAIGAITHCLSPTEKNISYLSTQLDSVKLRMKQSQRKISGATIDTYINRAASAVSHFLAWKQDPARWEKELANSSSKKLGRIRLSHYSPSADLASKKPQNLTESFTPRAKNRIQLRTDNGSVFTIDFPEEFFMKDVLRVIWALAAHAKDFDYKELIHRLWSV